MCRHARTVEFKIWKAAHHVHRKHTHTHTHTKHTHTHSEHKLEGVWVACARANSSATYGRLARTNAFEISLFRHQKRAVRSEVIVAMLAEHEGRYACSYGQ